MNKELEKRLADLASASANDSYAERLAHEQHTLARNEARNAYAAASQGLLGAAETLFTWLDSEYGRSIRARMRTDRVARLRISPYVDIHTGAQTEQLYKGCAWVSIEASEKPALRLESFTTSFGGPWYRADTAAQAIRGREDFDGHEAAIVAAAQAVCK